MIPKTKGAVLSIAFATLIVVCGGPLKISKELDLANANGKMPSMPNPKPENPVHSIVMPHDEPIFPPGPGRDEFVSACVICHSPQYITMQPRFSHATWLGEVKKMKDVYGAHISDDEVTKIAEYLFLINGESDAARPPKGGTYGE
ncbi:MAG TPA: cytochrome c [Candidatus Saccharimonadales bacterium]|jgi:hypothetical protein|nr:cytochrome c [Candidatus Saccharimonadales bacterium]